MHHLHRRSSAHLCFFIVLVALASSAPTQQSAFFHLPDAATPDLSSVALLQQPPNNSSIAATKITPRVNTSDYSIPESAPSLPSNLTSTGGVTNEAGIWDISLTLSLDLDIGIWRLSPEKVLDTLEAAENVVGKKPAAALLEEKFTQRTGSRLTGLIFEVWPDTKDEWKLSWGDVGEVLGEERGLPRFFRETGEWRNVDFQIVHQERGVLGEGWIRKWYMLDDGRNGTGLETG
ncbi:hypothetical protein IMSHALPRED_009854 [Imshaugia aleurites]|uniref:Uncharacterized protein n=1 Tax=Imshaugia aleurites TaxID=172621 RepID=A0A8H3G2Z6_9LECA|nr:hypothetical protein IMSHALPRED_009854 [Imshaugia aleurites]